jgi:hypothetical protein
MAMGSLLIGTRGQCSKRTKGSILFGISNLTLDTYSDQFSGPLYIQVFHPDEFVYDVLTITCHWYDGLFRNDYYVIGVIANTADLEALQLSQQ